MWAESRVRKQKATRQNIIYAGKADAAGGGGEGVNMQVHMTSAER